VQAARAHTEAVARHLDRLAQGTRSATRGVPAAPSVPRLGELSTLLLADASPGALLRAALHVAASAIDGADGVSVTIHRSGRVETAAASNPDVAEADRAQYGVLAVPLETRPGGLGALNVYARRPGVPASRRPGGGAVAVAEALTGQVAVALTVWPARAPSCMPPAGSGRTAAPW
jgi:hypothetical protein